MLLTAGGLEEYLANAADLLERFGVALDLRPDEDLDLDESPSGSLSFELRGFLPDGRNPPRAVLEVREIWQPAPGNAFTRTEYEFELLDHERGFRRAFHLHDAEAFVRRFQVVVHEHCEGPIGSAPCAHMAGYPVRDVFRGVELLVDAWIDSQTPDCAVLPCLE